MPRKEDYEELQEQILRSIARNTEADARSARLPKGAIWRSFALKATAAQLFAAGNGWQHAEFKRWDEIEALVCTPCSEQVRGLVYEPLLFVDKRGRPVAFATQPSLQERRQLNDFLRSAPGMGLHTNIPPAAYASIAEPGWRQFLVFTHQRLPVRWLVEQEEENSPFSVHSSEAPSFRKFLKEARLANST
jgi:hypothetical protein